MGTISTFSQFLWENRTKLLELSLEHLGLTFLSLLLAILIAVPAGILITRRPKLASFTLGFAGILQTIPSIALLGFLIPLLGIGLAPAIFALFIYALLPILRNTYTGIKEVDASILEAAEGMGMTERQVLGKVQLPLAMPVIFAGVRTATVINVGVAALAAYIGAGGLGEFIFGGIALNNSDMILAGALPAALLAILLDQLLGRLQRMNTKRLVATSKVALFLIPVFSMANYLPQYVSPGWQAGFAPEFVGRKDGYESLVNKYGLSFNTLLLDAALMYSAVRDGEVEVISGYSTDGRINAFDLSILEDDKNAFPPYHCVPTFNGNTLKKHPELLDVFDLIAHQINDSTMMALNYQVDFLKKSPAEVAKSFLEERNLWKPDRSTGGVQIAMGSKIFTEQYILLEIFSQLIDGYTDLDVKKLPGLGGTIICFEALKSGEIDLYAEYTGTGFLALLSPPDALVNEIIDQPDEVYKYVKEEAAKQFDIQWLEPLGFNNTYALMMRKETAKEMGIRTISDLKEVMEE